MESDIMAYMNQEKKATINAALKLVMPQGWKYSLSVDNHSTIVCTLTSAPVDLIAQMQANNNRIAERRGETAWVLKGHGDVNPYHHAESFDAQTQPIIEKIFETLKSADWFDDSDSQSDYFNCAYYVALQVGKWNKPFVLTA
jgi:hypothetical protein